MHGEHKTKLKFISLFAEVFVFCQQNVFRTNPENVIQLSN